MKITFAVNQESNNVRNVCKMVQKKLVPRRCTSHNQEEKNRRLSFSGDPKVCSLPKETLIIVGIQIDFWGQSSDAKVPALISVEDVGFT